jgi:5-amino-6-(5-phosphoribosylamino)uracil reductase
LPVWPVLLVADRPYTLLSCAISIDGYLDDATTTRLVLSNDADLERVDAVRAGCDAILVGAGTVRTDNPRLLVGSQARRDERTSRGLPPSPIKVTVTEHAHLDPESNFFTDGDGEKLVYCSTSALAAACHRLRPVATIVHGGQPVDFRWMSEDLHARGVRRLMVEGGGSVLTQFLAAGLADELQMVVASLFVGESEAPRFVGGERLPWNLHRRPNLVEVSRIDDQVLLRYSLSTRFQPRPMQVA